MLAFYMETIYKFTINASYTRARTHTYKHTHRTFEISRSFEKKPML